MSNTIYKVQIRVYTDELMKFYKGNPEYGSKDKPYPAELFYEMVSPYASFYGPLRNILVLQNNCIYQWVLEAVNGIPLKFSSSDDDSQMDMEMITNDPSNEKWKKVFKDAPDMQPDGKLKVKTKNPNENVFDLKTSTDVSGNGQIKYNFLFEFKDGNGNTKFGLIDPLADTELPPPPLSTEAEEGED